MDRRSYLKTSLALGGGLLIPAGVLGLVGCSGTSSSPELGAINGKIMGTGYSIRLGDSLQDHKLQALGSRILSKLQQIDSHMSTWRADSELSLFNVSEARDWIKVTPATAQVVAHALDTSNSSEGAFDVTVGPLVDLWGFGAKPNLATGTIPAANSIRQALQVVDSSAIEVDLQNNAIRKHNAAMQLDLSGIAKGYAVDQVAGLLDAEGFGSYLVEVGGELKARGLKPDGSAWKVAIERPLAGQRDVFRVLNLANRAIATSGDYRNFFADAGQRYSHSIDPRTGQPVSHELASVSVVSESTMNADALSTALMILGPDDAMDFAVRHQIAAHLILKSGSALKEVYSPEFEKLLG